MPSRSLLDHGKPLAVAAEAAAATSAAFDACVMQLIYLLALPLVKRAQITHNNVLGLCVDVVETAVPPSTPDERNQKTTALGFRSCGSCTSCIWAAKVT